MIILECVDVLYLNTPYIIGILYKKVQNRLILCFSNKFINNIDILTIQRGTLVS